MPFFEPKRANPVGAVAYFAFHVVGGGAMDDDDVGRCIDQGAATDAASSKMSSGGSSSSMSRPFRSEIEMSYYPCSFRRTKLRPRSLLSSRMSRSKRRQKASVMRSSDSCEVVCTA